MMSSGKSKNMGSLGFVFPHLLLLLSASFLLISSSAQENLPDPEKSTAFFFFGDGVFDTGNLGRIESESDTNYNHPPYGTTHFKIPTGRPSDGRLIVDYMAETSDFMLPPYRITPYNAKIKSMWRYGVSFATIRTYDASPENSETVPFLEQQLENFEKVYEYLKATYKSEDVNTLISNSIYIFSPSAFDFLVNRPRNYEELGKIADGIFNLYKTIIEKIYEKGGRKFAFQNIEPFEEMPYYKRVYGDKRDCEFLYSAPLFKELLKHQLDHWDKCTKSDGSKLFEGARLTYFDYFKFLVEAGRDKSKYEISEEACCGSVLENGKLTCGDVINKEKVKVCDNPNKYLWFDPIYPTDVANAHFVSQLWENHHYAHPYNLRQLYSANYEPEPEPKPIN